MQIGGLLKTTLLDYPGHVAATVFTRGCNFRCPFCQNGELLGCGEEDYSEDEIMAFLKKRSNVLSGVCISGGEPTLQPDLPEFIKKVRAMGYLVKIDTNGTNPSMLKSLIDEGLIDFVAMDIKNSPEKYAETAGIENSPHKDELLKAVSESIGILLAGNIPYEFRTTVVKGFHTKEDMEVLSGMIKGAEAYYIQSYRDSENVIQKERCASYDKEELTDLISDMTDVSPLLRGVE